MQARAARGTPRTGVEPSQPPIALNAGWGNNNKGSRPHQLLLLL